MKTDKVFLVGIHRSSFRAGEPAEIIGVSMVTPGGMDVHQKQRLCYHIQFSDGIEDYVPISDSENYEIITFFQLIKGEIPKVTK